MKRKMAKMLTGTVLLTVFSVALLKNPSGIVYAEDIDTLWETMGPDEFWENPGEISEEESPGDGMIYEIEPLYFDESEWDSEDEYEETESLESLWNFDESELEGADPKRADLLSQKEGKKVVLDKNLSNQIWLDVYPLAQYPDFPTGCEVTSLTMVLNYEGFEATIGEIADRYLKKGEPASESFRDIFWGDPRSSEAFGCYAPVIVDAANKYLKKQGSNKRAIDLTGTEFKKLYEELRYGYPVLVWGSMYIDQDIVEVGFWEINGETVTWPGNEHCMVLIGFDLENDTVRVCDPLRGIMVYDREQFEYHYMEMECQAIVIKQEEEALPNILPTE